MPRPPRRPRCVFVIIIIIGPNALTVLRQPIRFTDAGENLMSMKEKRASEVFTSGPPPPHPQVKSESGRDDVVACSEELEEMIKALLKTLMGFQERARLKDEVKAKKVRWAPRWG
jgi:hypothetical protein